MITTIQFENIRYKVILIDEYGTNFNLSRILTNAEFTDTITQLAVALSLEMPNIFFNGQWLVDMLKFKNKVIVFYSLNNGKTFNELMRCEVVKKNYNSSVSKLIQLGCLDELWNFQRSEERYLALKGTSSAKFLKQVLSETGIPYNYQGPDFAFPSIIKFTNDPVAEIVLSILKLAQLRGKGKYILRVNQGLLEVIPRGSNTNIATLYTNDLVDISYEGSIEDIVTVVKVMTTYNSLDGEPGSGSGYKGGGETDKYGVLTKDDVTTMDNGTIDDPEIDLSDPDNFDESGAFVAPMGLGDGTITTSGSAQVTDNYGILGDDYYQPPLGNSKDEGIELAKLEATLNRNIKYGRFQKIVYRTKDDDISEAMQEANDILAEFSNPIELTKFDGLVIPTLRKGDKIILHAGNQIGTFYIKTVTQNLMEKKMTVEVEK
jgi:hypothetical protein